MTDDERKAIHVYARGGWKPAPSWSAARTGQQREGNVTNDEVAKAFEDYFARSVAAAAKMKAERRIIPIWNDQPTRPVNAERMVDEIMARIERDGAIHKSSLMDVIAMVAGKPTPRIEHGSGSKAVVYDPPPGQTIHTAADELLKRVPNGSHAVMTFNGRAIVAMMGTTKADILRQFDQFFGSGA